MADPALITNLNDDTRRAIQHLNKRSAARYVPLDTRINLPAGTALLPSLIWDGDTNTGLYHIANNTIGVSAAGTLRLTLGDTALTSTVPVTVPNGTAAAPSLNFASWSNVGLYGTSGKIGFATAGTEQMTLDGWGLIVNPQILAASGTAAYPGVAFSGNAQTGMRLWGANGIGFSTAGTHRVEITTSTVTSALPILAPDGSAAAVSIGFANDSNTGMYRIGENSLGFSAAGLRLTVGTTALTTAVPLRSGNGSATAPSYSFSGDTNTGMYLVANDFLGFTTGGAHRLQLVGVEIIHTGLQTTGTTSTNIVWDAAGSDIYIRRYSSSRRYKTDIRDMTDVEADRILQLRPVRYRPDRTTSQDPDWSTYGLIAEEVAEVDPRYVGWGMPDECDCDAPSVKVRDENGELKNNPDFSTRQKHLHQCLFPDAVGFTDLVVPLIQVVKRQEARIEALENNRQPNIGVN